MSYLVIGLSGVGKTTVGKVLADSLGFKLVNFGDLMEGIAGDAYPCDEDNIELMRKAVVEGIGQRSDNAGLIVDAHCILKDQLGKVSFGFASGHLLAMKVRVMIIVEADPSLIFERRLKDMHIRNDRPMESIDTIGQDQMMQREYLFSLSMQLGIRYYLFDNSKAKELYPESFSDVIKFISQSGEVELI